MGGRMLRGLLSMRRIRLITVLALIGFACAALAGWTAGARRQRAAIDALGHYRLRFGMEQPDRLGVQDGQGGARSGLRREYQLRRCCAD